MWQTTIERRTLTGPEAALVREALCDMLDLMEVEELYPNDRWPWDVDLFDQLSYPQKLASLVHVGGALLNNEVEPLAPIAVNEAAVGAICECVAQNVRFEVDQDEQLRAAGNPYRTYWRSLLRNVFVEAERDLADWDESDLPSAERVDLEPVELLVAVVSDCVLWDVFMDQVPECTRRMNARASFRQDYFNPPYAGIKDVPELEATLARLISGHRLEAA